MKLIATLMLFVLLSSAVFAIPEAAERKQWRIELNQTGNLTESKIVERLTGLQNALSHVANENARTRIEANIARKAVCKGNCTIDVSASIDGTQTIIKKTVPGKFLGVFKVQQIEEDTLDDVGNQIRRVRNGWHRLGFLVKDE